MTHSPLALRTEIAALLPRLRRFARAVAGRHDEADDLVQSVIEHALQHLDEWQDGTRLDGWLLWIAAGAWGDDPVEPHPAAGARDASRSIDDAMARLPDDQRVAVALVLVQGLTYAEAAAVLEIPADTLARRLALGRDALQQAIGDGAAPSADVDRSTRMAYVDGEMPEAGLIAFEAQVAHDAALFDAVERERAQRSALKAHYDAVLDEPVPAGLLDLLVLSDDVGAEDGDLGDLDTLDAEPAPSRFAPSRPASTGFAPSSFASSGFAPSRFASSRPADSRLELVPPAAAPAREAAGMAPWRAWGGMLACLALGVLLGARTVPASAPVAASAAGVFAVDDGGTIAAAGPLREALEQRAGGSPSGSEHGVAIGLSFRDKALDDCRTFAVDTAMGIACKSNGQWSVTTLEHAPSAAAGTLSPTLLLTIDAMRDGDTFDAAAETAARAKGWQP